VGQAGSPYRIQLSPLENVPAHEAASQRWNALQLHLSRH
jgi:hypothetical protein